MKITFESYGKTTTIETKNDDIDIHELKDILHGLCISQGWGENVLETIFKK